jgi:Lrp/AsnC family transcriptional regulator, leucine-responsive regulatory protein
LLFHVLMDENNNSINITLMEQKISKSAASSVTALAATPTTHGGTAGLDALELDATDLALLRQLQVDASLTNLELAKRVFTSPPTCLRRVKRLRELGLIERQVAILQPERVAAAVGHGLTSIVEITLDRQDAAALQAFEAHAVADPAVQQCYRVSPGPDFVLILHVPDMPAHLAASERLFTSDANVRNVKAYFSAKRAKFETSLRL